MTDRTNPVIDVSEDRFDRFRRIAWWDQAKLREAKVLVVGAGALGNEVIKNLALLGVGNLAIVDMDRIEASNLCRSVLFRSDDEGHFKADVAAAAAKAIYPDLNTFPLIGNLLANIGLGWFRWADVVVGALDNREARVAVNSYCAQTATPWIDGGIEVLNGIVRGFAPPETACYECTMGEADWNVLNQRRSCSLLARHAFSGGGTPTTPTTASVIGAIQAQEVVKRLHDMATLSGSGYVFEGLGHNSYTVEYTRNPDCPWHEASPRIESAAEFSQATTFAELWDFAATRLGEVDAIDFSREIVTSLQCVHCGSARKLFKPIDLITQAEAVCEACGNECQPELTHSLDAESDWRHYTVGEFGLPKWDVVWARNSSQSIGIELAGDATSLLVRDQTSHV
ncbi:MAG: ThiF family adenylyltransferase [Pirellulaceae bacterium]